MLRKKENLAGYAFLMPSLIGFVVLKLYPVLFALVMSFCKWDLISGYDQIEWVGLANFLDMLDDRYVGISFKNTLSYVLMVVPGQLILGLLFAIILDKCVFFKRYFRTTFFMPYIANTVAVSRGVDGAVSSVSGACQQHASCNWRHAASGLAVQSGVGAANGGDDVHLDRNGLLHCGGHGRASGDSR